jgi:predicted O-methyltransferase YrrM
MLLSRNKNLRLLWGMLETANLLSLRLAWKNRAAVRSFPGEIFRCYMSLAKQDRWQCRNVFEIFPNSKAVRATIEHLPQAGMNSPPDDLTRLAFITKLLEPKTIFEIGTYRGRTALNFALNSPPDCTVYTLDLPVASKPGAIQRAYKADANLIGRSRPGIDYEGKDVSGKIVQLYGDSQTFDFLPFCGKMDLLFIDGAHDYEAVRVDTTNALRMLKPGGVILWDDFADYGDQNGVTRAVLSLIPGEEVIQVDHTHIALHRPKFANGSAAQGAQRKTVA